MGWFSKLVSPITNIVGDIFGGGSTPSIVQSDPKAEADAAANSAAKVANADAASRKKRKKGSSLLATGAQGATDSGSSLLATGATGKPTLGA